MLDYWTRRRSILSIYAFFGQTVRKVPGIPHTGSNDRSDGYVKRSNCTVGILRDGFMREITRITWPIKWPMVGVQLISKYTDYARV